MSRPIVARIDLAALKHNLNLVRRHTPRSKTLVVVKSNGYGHGFLRVAKALESADGFAVLGIDDAIVLREAGINRRIMLLEGFFSHNEVSLAAQYNLSVVVHRLDQIEMIESAKPKAKLDILLKINTGMNRLGLTTESFSKALSSLQTSSYVDRVMLMTHFATADDAQGANDQLQMFNRITQGLKLERSLANSAAILRYPDTHGDWVRPGIMIYGCSPFIDQSSQELGLRPAMTLQSEIIAVQQLKPGDRVGYGGVFSAEREMRIGIVACGYADGYLRQAFTGTPIRVQGKLTSTVGRVSMDMMYADLTDIPLANVGSPVVLWGEGLPIEDVARAVGTVNYELLCALAMRVPMKEVNGEIESNL